MQLVIASKNYSSWSMRPWVLMHHFGMAFDETVIALGQPDTKERIARYSPTGRLPYLKDGDLQVWDSLAICETLADRFPSLPLWPADPVQRAHARAISAEMHAGFSALRNALPMNIRGRSSKVQNDADVLADIARVDALWSDCLEKSGGPFLFGDFTIADVMYVAVVMRFNSYPVTLSPAARAYAERITALPSVVAWTEAALLEPAIDYYDVLL